MWWPRRWRGVGGLRGDDEGVGGGVGGRELCASGESQLSSLCVRGEHKRAVEKRERAIELE